MKRTKTVKPSAQKRFIERFMKSQLACFLGILLGTHTGYLMSFFIECF